MDEGMKYLMTLAEEEIKKGKMSDFASRGEDMAHEEQEEVQGRLLHDRHPPPGQFSSFSTCSVTCRIPYCSASSSVSWVHTTSR